MLVALPARTARTLACTTLAVLLLVGVAPAAPAPPAVPPAPEPAAPTLEPARPAAPGEPAPVGAEPGEWSVTRKVLALLVNRVPAFSTGERSVHGVSRAVPIPSSEAYWAEVRWKEAGNDRAAIVTVGPVRVDPSASYLAEEGGLGIRDLVEDVSFDDFVATLESSLNRARQRKTMADMRNIATANATMRVDTGRYAQELSDLGGRYMRRVPTTDAWGSTWMYVSEGNRYSLLSLGSNGVPGPSSPDVWEGEPFDPDIGLVNGDFINAPRLPTRLPDSERLIQRLYQPWMRAPRREEDLQATTMSIMRTVASANETMKSVTGAYASALADLTAGDYVRTQIEEDGWGNPLSYTSNGSGYWLFSFGCDAASGPQAPPSWKGLPCEPDIVMRDSQFLQAPEPD